MIDAISGAISQTQGCVLLDVDAGPSTNRTVYTFVGTPEDVVEGALRAARVAFQLVDMSRHKGDRSGLGWEAIASLVTQHPAACVKAILQFWQSPYVSAEPRQPISVQP